MKQIFVKIPTPEANELKKFVFILAGFIAVVFGCLLAWLLGKILIWPWLASILLLSLYFVNDNLLIPVYKVWMIIGQILGHVISQLVLLLIFFLLVTPIGLIFRFSQNRNSNQPQWIDSADPAQNDLERPY